ncbi:hypothetical protein ACO0QE_002675 [Hanseniaspora vineae]
MGLKKFEMAAAGHEGTLTNENESLFFKPTNNKEVRFYSDLEKLREAEDPECFSAEESTTVSLCDWAPVFVGTMQEGINGDPTQITNYSHFHEIAHSPALDQSTTKSYIVLENLLQGYKSPNVLDIKLGKTLYDQHASQEKKARLEAVSNSTTSGLLGARICGMKIQKHHDLSALDASHFDLDTTNNYYSINKFYGRSLKTESDLLDAFKFFFQTNTLSEELVANLLQSFLTRLQLLYNTLLDTPVRLISSSLLFIYETDSKRWSNSEDVILDDDFAVEGSEDEEQEAEEEEDRAQRSLSKLKLIDYAHSEFVQQKERYDENVLFGIESLINIFKKMQL